MADEAFALSPISARATTPSEADYEAIHDVFMETSRGRWFLAEFARRNKNADTRMVLDAVARIEESLATPKNAAPDNSTEALASIRTLIESARLQAAAALAGQESNEDLALAYKCVRTVREVAWTLREYGSDSRICDKLDTQANTIDRSLDQLAIVEPRDSVLAIFDDLIRQLDELNPGETSVTAVATSLSGTEGKDTAPVETASSADQPPTVSTAGVVETTSAQQDIATSTPLPSGPSQSGNETFAAAASDHTVAPEEISATATTSFESDDAEDDAVLDMIAMEMAAPDADDIDDSSSAMVDDADDDFYAIDTTATHGVPFHAEAHASLGAALLANGTIRQHALPGTGRFVAIQRLSQIEKVALFS